LQLARIYDDAGRTDGRTDMHNAAKNGDGQVKNA